MGVHALIVVEIAPSDIGVENAYESGDWDAVWAQCLRDSLGVRPVRPGSWLVALSEFGDDASIDGLLRRRALDEEGRPRGPETLSPLLGGCGFDSGSDPLRAKRVGWAPKLPGSPTGLLPGCCHDLADLEVWLDVAEAVELSKRRLSIGHATLSVSVEGGVVDIVEEPETFTAEPVRYRFSQREMKATLAHAVRLRDEFERRLRRGLCRLGVAEVNEIASVLCGRDTSGDD